MKCKQNPLCLACACHFRLVISKKLRFACIQSAVHFNKRVLKHIVCVQFLLFFFSFFLFIRIMQEIFQMHEKVPAKIKLISNEIEMVKDFIGIHEGLALNKIWFEFIKENKVWRCIWVWREQIKLDTKYPFCPNKNKIYFVFVFLFVSFLCYFMDKHLAMRFCFHFVLLLHYFHRYNTSSETIFELGMTKFHYVIYLHIQK